MKVAELEGAALDWAVAKAQGWVNFPTDSKEKGCNWYVNPATAPFCRYVPREFYKPSVDSRQGLPLIEDAGISIQTEDAGWSAYYRGRLFELDNSDCFVLGSTMLEAGLRCLCLNHFGEDIDIPEELQ